MRILFLTSRLPFPPNRGDRLRAFNFIRSLSQDHEIHLFSFVADKVEQEHISHLKEYCQDIQVIPMNAVHSTLSVALNFWRNQPLQALYYRSTAMQSLVDRSISRNKFDVAYIHLFRMAPYLVKHENIYRIVDLTDVISQELMHSMPYRRINSRLLYSIERSRIARYERWVAGHFEEIWLISKHDSSVLATDCPNANIKIVRNGVDTEVFFPTDEEEIPNNMILVGHMGVFHNIDAAVFLAQDILPKVRAKIPDANLKIVGADPIGRVRALDSNSGVEVTGFIPNLNKALNQASVFVAPLRFAAGVQNKVLEAMAAGRPVVTTGIVNAGLNAKPGRDLLIAEGAQELANTIVSLMKNKNFGKELGQSARHFVLQNYNWDYVRKHMNQIIPV